MIKSSPGDCYALFYNFEIKKKKKKKKIQKGHKNGAKREYKDSEKQQMS